MSRESAGAAIRALRESRDWSLADFAAETGISVMGLSYLERGARKPHKSTIHKVENGLGLPAGTYHRLLVAADPEVELDRLIAAKPPEPQVQTLDGTGSRRPAQRYRGARGVRRGAAGSAQSGDRSVAGEYIKRIRDVYSVGDRSVQKGRDAGSQLLARRGERRRRLGRPTDDSSAGAGSDAHRPSRPHPDELERSFRPCVRALRPTGDGNCSTGRRHR